MLIHGQKIDAHYIVPIVIPRPAGNIIFKAQPLNKEQHADFLKICPEPQPKLISKPGWKQAQPHTESPDYLAERKEWFLRRTEYMYVQSLAATEGLTWETVLMLDPSTWGNAITELSASGFLEGEITAILRGVVTANGLDPSKIEQATKDFLAGQDLVNS